MNLEHSESGASCRGRSRRDPPPPTYLWEEVRRSRSRGGYPWTILDKEPLPDQLDIELLLAGKIQFITVDEDDRRLETESTYERGKHSSRGRQRFRDRERIKRSRSEPTTNELRDNATFVEMDGDRNEVYRLTNAPSVQSGESEDFSLNDEDIPDFVMAYLQSDKGNLDEDIPDHILEYIQSRAALLERNQKYAKPPPQEEIFYTEDELRIINEARKRLEEQGEFATGPDPPSEDMNNFDDFFARAVMEQETAEEVGLRENEPVEYPGAAAIVNEPVQEEALAQETKKGNKFNLKNLSMPGKLKLPKLRNTEKKKKVNADEPEANEQPVDESGKQLKHKQKYGRRPQSSSPIRQKISQQLESWNANLKKVLPRKSKQDGQIKSFVALLPGRSRSHSATKTKATENQYEEIGRPRDTIDENDAKAGASYNLENEGEETMEDVENLPESEEAEVVGVNPEIVDSEVIDALNHRGQFVEVNIEEPNNQVASPTGSEQKDPTVEKFGALAARGRQAFELTKSKIQQTLSKEQLQATRNKLQSTLSKQNLEATRKKVQSTLSPKNIAATGNKLQSSLTNTLKKRKGGNKKPDVDSEPTDRVEIAPLPIPAETHESYYDLEAPTATARRRAKKTARVDSNTAQELNTESGNLETNQQCQNVEAENFCAEEEEEEEIEPRLEFSLNRSDGPRPESVDQSTETLPEDIEEEKENVVVRPSRRRFSNKRRKFGATEDQPRPHSIHCESNISSAWPGARSKYPLDYPAVSQEVLATFTPPINSLDALDCPTRGSTPSKPPRSRSRKSLNSMSDLHLYSNVAPPRRAKRGQSKKSGTAWSTSTWPRKSPSVEYPTAPRRLKPKQTKQTDINELGDQMQTWPRRRRNNKTKSPPSVPKRARSKRKLDDPSPGTGDATELNDLKKRIQTDDQSNILTDPDTLFGVDSRFIDEEEMNRKQTPVPNLNNLSEADVLFGAESRFIDEEELRKNQSSLSDIIKVSEADVSAEPDTIDDGSINDSSNGPIASSTPLPPAKQSVYDFEVPQQEIANDIMEQIHQQIIPAAPAAPAAPSRRSKSASHEAKHYNPENTWPRFTSSGPTAPIRRKQSIKSQTKAEETDNIKTGEKELPLMPTTTPTENYESTSRSEEFGNTSSAQAGINQILEILASAFPTAAETDVAPLTREVAHTDDVPDESEANVQTAPEEEKTLKEDPYATINQDQKKAPPPRPPPPAYAPENASSYSYIYTVPRRKKHEKVTKPSASPERPPRTYCTIRPHRPPRRTRAVTDTIVLPVIAAEQLTRTPPLALEMRTRSFSVGDEAKEERDLQSAPVVERMRARPLPPPPRLKRLQSRSPPPKPPRSQSSTLKRRKESDPFDVVQQPHVREVAPETVPIVLVTDDGYEPPEEPVNNVEEISIGIQTDPLSEYDESNVIDDYRASECCDRLLEAEQQTVQSSNDLSSRLVEALNNLSCERNQPIEPGKEELVDSSQHVKYDNIQQRTPTLCADLRAKCLVEDSKETNLPELPEESITKGEQQPVLNSIPSVPEHTSPIQNQVEERPKSQPKELVTQDSDGLQDHVRRPPRQLRDEREDDEGDSFSRIPPSFAQLSARLPPLQVDLPNRLQLSELEVERLNVREVTAERLVVSSVDTNSLQVCQMVTSNASGQLVFSLGPGVALPPLLLAPASTNEEVHEKRPDDETPCKKENQPSELKENTEPPQVKEKSPEPANSPKSETAQVEHAGPLIPQPTEITPVATRPQENSSAEISTPNVVAPATSTSVPSSVCRNEPPLVMAATVLEEPVHAQQLAPLRVTTENATADQSVNRELGRSEDPNLSDLALQLAAVSARRLGATAVTAASETYSIAQRVAELGWRQLNEHLQRQGIYFDDKERENVKAVLLMLLLVISAIFLLGPGRTRSINHWDFYFPN